MAKDTVESQGFIGCRRLIEATLNVLIGHFKLVATTLFLDRKVFVQVASSQHGVCENKAVALL